MIVSLTVTISIRIVISLNAAIKGSVASSIFFPLSQMQCRLQIDVRITNSGYCRVFYGISS